MNADIEKIVLEVIENAMYDEADYETDYGLSGSSEPYRYIANWPDMARKVLDRLRSLPVEQRMEAMGMHKVDPFETFTAEDGMPAIRGRSALWTEEANDR